MFEVYVYEVKNKENKELVGTRPTLEKAEKFADLMETRINWDYNIEIFEVQK